MQEQQTQKRYKVACLNLGSKTNRVYKYGDVVTADDFPGDNVEALVASKHLVEYDEAAERERLLAKADEQLPDGVVLGSEQRTDNSEQVTDGDGGSQGEDAPGDPGPATLGSDNDGAGAPNADDAQGAGNAETAHVVTQADLDNNPDLVAQGVKVGDTIGIPNDPESVAKPEEYYKGLDYPALKKAVADRAEELAQKGLTPADQKKETLIAALAAADTNTGTTNE